MRNLLKQSVGVAVVFAAVACGTNPDAGTSEAAEGAADGGTSMGASPSAPSKNTNSMRAAASSATGASGSTGKTAEPEAGMAGTTLPTTAGTGGTGGTTAGSGGQGASMADEDAGMPAAAGSGGSAGHAGSAAAGSGGSPAAGSGGSAGHAGSAAAGSGGGAGHAGAAAAGSGGGAASAATFTEVYALMNTGCAGASCHVRATAPGGMLSMLDKATAYRSLVNVDSTKCLGEKRVVPKDPAKSELVASLKHVQLASCTRTPRMPDNLPQWPDSDIAIVTSWIEAGALDN